MQAGQGGDHAAIAFVGNDANATGFGNAEVRAADADIGLQEGRAQVAAGSRGHGFHVFGVGHSQQVVEGLGDFLAAQVHRGGDDVGRALVP